MSIGDVLNETHNGWRETSRRMREDESTVSLPCPYCGKYTTYPEDSPVGSGILVPYCHGGDCEDLDVWA